MAQSGPGPPISIINQGNDSHRGPQANLMKTVSQMTFALPSYVQVCVELTKTNCDSHPMTQALSSLSTES